MSTEIIAVETCEHPKLGSWLDSLSGDFCYQCTSCGKKAIIPVRKIIIEEDSQHISHMVATTVINAKVRGIVGLVFGEQWAKRVRVDICR